MAAEKGKHCSDFAGRFLSELLNNGALTSLHVVGLNSHASFFMQLQILLTWLTSGDCGGKSILFPNHANTAMALWKRIIVLLEDKWVLLVPKHLLYWLQQISIHEVNVRILVDISINHYQSANTRKLFETFLRGRNRIASIFILSLSIISPTTFTFIISL